MKIARLLSIHRQSLASAVSRVTGISITIAWVLFCSFALVVLSSCEKTKGSKIISEGDVAPDFQLQTPEGKIVKLSDYKGKVVMVHFWATWCPPCVDEIPTLDRLYTGLFGKDFELLAVSVDEGGADAVRAFMKKNKLILPALLDPGRSVANSYGTFKFPETYVVDRGGIVREKVIGPRDWTLQENLKVLKELLSTR